MSGYEEVVLTNLELISTKEMVLEHKITEKVQNVNYRGFSEVGKNK
jgi:hypothetical protein